VSYQRLGQLCALSRPRADRGAGALDGQARLGQHRQGDVPVLGLVAADLVVVESGLDLALLEAAFHRPSQPRHLDQLSQAGIGGPVAEVVGQLTVSQAAATSSQWPRPGWCSGRMATLAQA
jgi:hypothetical protein